MSGFAMIHGKPVPMGGGDKPAGGPAVQTGPRKGQYWHHPTSGNKHYGPVPAKHRQAVAQQRGEKPDPGKTSYQAPLKAPLKDHTGPHGSSAPAGKAPRPGHDAHPKPGAQHAKPAKGHEGHKPGGEKKEHEGPWGDVKKDLSGHHENLLATLGKAVNEAVVKEKGKG